MPWAKVPADARATERHALALELRFSYSAGSIAYLGTGRTRNISDGGICFEFDQDPGKGSDLELSISLPSRLQSVCPLELVVRGPVLRRDAAVAVIRMDSYEVRTCGNPSFHQLADRGVTCDISL